MIRNAHAMALTMVAVLAATTSARADEYIMQFAPGGPFGVGVGGELVVIKKQRGLPNMFGADDIFGRKVETGSIIIQYVGSTPEGLAMLRRIDIDIHSTASTASRSPGFVTGSSSVQGYGNAYGAQVDGNSHVYGQRPTRESNTVLPPRVIDFTLQVGQTYPLPTGHVVAIQSATPSQVGFFIKKAATGRGRPGEQVLPPPTRQ
jgi:hypothetical protein